MTPASIRALPKAELHLHIEGTLEPELVFALARRNRVQLPFADVASLRLAEEFADLQSFLNLYYACMDVLRGAEDFHDLAEAYLCRAAQDGVRHAEIFFDPQAHLARGISLDEVLGGLAASAGTSRERHGVSVGLIPCFLRDRGPDEAMQTWSLLADYHDQFVAVGLDSAEIGHPPEQFAQVFEAAAGAGLHRVAHAGEEGPPDYIWQALDVLGVERVDHGIRCLEDEALVRRLVRDQIPLTVCPLSNVRLHCVATMADHPIAQMLAQGLNVTVNSDDPAYFGGYVGANYEALVTEAGLSGADLAVLADNSLRAAFGTVDLTARATHVG